ncbi:MAG: CHAP domain-containing protein [Nitrospiria bacterium]
MCVEIFTVKKRSLGVLFLVFSISFAALACMISRVEAVPCATPLSSYKDVPARSNEDYPYGSCDGPSVYGLKYQCVEYVRRFYHLVKGIETRGGMPGRGWDGNANTYFKSAGEMGLEAMENGGPTPPLPDDIISFTGGAHGHVAIITAVTNNHIEFIEQNFSLSGRGRVAYNPLTHHVAGRHVQGATLSVEGWLRPQVH